MMRIIKLAAALITVCLPPQSFAQNQEGSQAAIAFGARQSVSGLSLSPDGSSVAFIAPGPGQASSLYTQSLAAGAKARLAVLAAGKPERIGSCSWVANDRLVCTVYAVVIDSEFGLLYKSRLIALNADGSNLKVLSNQENIYTHGVLLGGGHVIDWLPDEDGFVLMVQRYLSDEHTGSRLGSKREGVGVDRVDTRTLDVTHVEEPRPEAVDYISDGRGIVRIFGKKEMRAGRDTGTINYSYRLVGSRDWLKLGTYIETTQEGFLPYAVDPVLNIAYGLKKNKNGRIALYSVKLDESLHEELVYEHPDVDVDGLIQIGRRQHVVGTSFVTDIRQSVYLSENVKKLLTALAKALPQQKILQVVDSSTDENKMLLFAGGDTDPGAYYVFDRKARNLQTFLVVRSELEGRKLANVKPVRYPADDGTMIPGYLTLPPGREDAKGLPAIVLPHGGPSARDEWGFDWLSQFYAARGFAVLQPNFRGSSGYGDAWFQQNGFTSWQVAIGDILAAGRWLVSQGTADPARLGIVGWSYGGYAALQSAVVDPKLFKAVVAIAPVTDLEALKEESRIFTNFNLVRQFVGDGPYMTAGSPINQAEKIKVPVLLFHGGLDRNVSVRQSKRMAERLRAVGANCELVIWDDLDHYLEDSSARAQMLSKSEAFLTHAFETP
ncbi:MAG: S9 family peptidase [Pseudomonadota bacterium]